MDRFSPNAYHGRATEKTAALQIVEKKNRGRHDRPYLALSDTLDPYSGVHEQRSHMLRSVWSAPWLARHVQKYATLAT